MVFTRAIIKKKKKKQCACLQTTPQVISHLWLIQPLRNATQGLAAICKWHSAQCARGQVTSGRIMRGDINITARQRLVTQNWSEGMRPIFFLYIISKTEWFPQRVSHQLLTSNYYITRKCTLVNSNRANWKPISLWLCMSQVYPLGDVEPLTKVNRVHLGISLSLSTRLYTPINSSFPRAHHHHNSLQHHIRAFRSNARGATIAKLILKRGKNQQAQTTLNPPKAKPEAPEGLYYYKHFVWCRFTSGIVYNMPVGLTQAKRVFGKNSFNGDPYIIWLLIYTYNGILSRSCKNNMKRDLPTSRNTR